MSMEQVANSAIDLTERLVKENKQLKLKLKFITKYNAKLAGIDIEKIDVRALKSLIGESYTNADKIRSMSDEELAIFIDSHVPCFEFCMCEDYICNEKCKEGIEKWLKSEAE